MQKYDSEKYAYQTFWSDEDQEFVATVLEFPSLSWLDDSAEKAESKLRELVAEILDDMAKNNERIPQPLGERRYSGTFNVRLPKSLHRKLVVQAANEGVSLNALVTQKLASS